MNHVVRKALWAILVVAAAGAAMPVASAEPRDEFLDELATLGVFLPGTDQPQTVAAGYRACDELRSGVSVLDEMAAVEGTYHLPPGQGTLFVSAATTNLCPDFAG
ncbi:Protein of unknown function (DUF732) [Mycolicibacterium chubuense NBB4]|uniref:DUF732 domain-containing protein n=1 Tax=Mycolicibacterium chubuense (strain NBB4) TaxID=710421 RepID=I4BDA0_MYCCN|nr:DUF732 domain-containing protein [Mycolicibacterium chubuense]AFM15257.1 Protein of unknown function (DUF732) [Mycolicibacterium chubuense NBB4]